MKQTILLLFVFAGSFSALTSTAQSRFGESKFSTGSLSQRTATPTGNGNGNNGNGLGNGGSNTNPPANAPLDGSLCALLVVGAAYGAKQYRSKRLPS